MVAPNYRKLLAFGLSVAMPALPGSVNAKVEEAQPVGGEVAEPVPDPVQDLQEFRTIVEDGVFLPKADMLTFAGLAAAYRQKLPVDKDCGAPICVAAHAMETGTNTQADGQYFVGIDFALAEPIIDLPPEPLNLVFVIDRSGSMDHGKLGLAKEGLLEALSELRDSDRVALIEFSDSARMLTRMATVGEDRAGIEKAIRNLRHGGLTNMEAGLDLGLRLAYAEQAGGAENLHLILVTDERPNRHPSRTNGFMAMLREAGQRSIGVSVVGVDQVFDGNLAMLLSASSGARLYSAPEGHDLRGFFESEFAGMVAGSRDDARLILRPAAGVEVDAIFGVPQELVSRTAGKGVMIDLGRTYAGSEHGGVFVALSRRSDAKPVEQAAALLEAELRYRDVSSGDFIGQSAVASLSDNDPPPVLRLHQALADEFSTLRRTLRAYHSNRRYHSAWVDDLSELQERLDSDNLPTLSQESQMVDRIMLILARQEARADIAESGLVGMWEVRSRRGLTGASKRDLVELTAQGELIIRRTSANASGSMTRQTFQLSADQLFVDGTDLVFDYTLDSDRLTLIATRGGDRLKLRRTR